MSRLTLGFVLLLLLPGVGAAQKKPKKPVPSLEELQPKVDDAIHRGVDALLRTQQLDGSWPHHQYSYPVGPTALAVYTLVKSGLPLDHHGVSRGLRFLERRLSAKTYGAACQLMAFEATRDPRWKPEMKQLLDRLVRWQKDGGWSYPNGRIDLSNMQYAALGLRAARLAGLRVPKKTVLDLVECTLRFQEKPREADIPADAQKRKDGYARGAGRGQIAGFRYVPEGKRRATGSMTTAGIGTLVICRDLLGRRGSKRVRRKIDRAIELALDWMRVHWSVRRNPAGSGHLHYYLYGLERVGDLLRRESLCGHPWYREGAHFLVGNQKDDGRWNNDPGTCFALLFLKRATRHGGVTGSAGTDRTSRVYLAASDEADVRLRGAGNPHIALWIDGFNKKLRKRFPPERGARTGIQVESVTYLLDGRVLETVKGDPSGPWDGEPYAYKYRFAKSGRYAVGARVTVRNPEPKEGEEPTIQLDSPLLVVEVRDLVDERVVAAAKEYEENRLPAAPRLKIKTSTAERNPPGGGQPHWVLDGRVGTAWLCKKKDPLPWIRLRSSRAIKCRGVALWPATNLDDKGVNRYDTLREVEVYINRSLRPRVFKIEGPGTEPIRIDFKRRTDLRELEIRLTKRQPGKGQAGIAGLAEITVR